MTDPLLLSLISVIAVSLVSFTGVFCHGKDNPVEALPHTNIAGARAFVCLHEPFRRRSTQFHRRPHNCRFLSCERAGWRSYNACSGVPFDTPRAFGAFGPS